MKQAIGGVAAFVIAALLTAGAFFFYNHVMLVRGLSNVLSNQCSLVEERVISEAVRKALAEQREAMRDVLVEKRKEK